MRRVAPVFLFFAVLIVGVALRGQQPADKTLAGLKPAAGLQATLFASEPMVMNPTDMTVDERGRVWVLEGVNYRRASRNQPDLRAEGDRIVILEDTNGDGTADKSTVFDQASTCACRSGSPSWQQGRVPGARPHGLHQGRQRQDHQERSAADRLQRHRPRPWARGGVRLGRQRLLHQGNTG